MKKLPSILLLLLATLATPLLAGDNISALKITATIPVHTAVRPGGSFRVALLVENPTKQPIQFRTESCGWCGNWRTKGTAGFLGWDCTKNIRELIEIQPGGSFIDEITVSIEEEASAGKTTTQFGFASMPAGEVGWSNKIEIPIDSKAPVPAKNANLGGEGTRTLGPGCRYLPWRE